MTALTAGMQKKKAAAACATPKGDARFQQLEATLKRHPYRQDALPSLLPAE